MTFLELQLLVEMNWFGRLDMGLATLKRRIGGSFREARGIGVAVGCKKHVSFIPCHGSLPLRMHQILRRYLGNKSMLSLTK